MSESVRNETSFTKLGLNPWLVKQCNTMGIKTPTAIQANCIPEILKGKDCIGAAKTGSGKTLAFVLPILQALSEDPYGIFALVLTATRELAYQIADQFAVIGKGVNIRCTTIVGGMDMVQQGLELANKPHIVVATPGRLADHIETSETFSLQRIKFLVMDEADRLLDGPFNDQIRTIFSALGKKRQNLFFSATITDALGVVKGVTGNEVFLYEAPYATVEQLEQFYVLCPQDVKDAYLVQTIRTYRETDENGSIIIFTHSCKSCQALSMMFNDIGFENVALHGMMKQRERLAALNRFKSSQVKIFIGTDVASRGLDIPTVELVLNHSLPKITKEYIHRVGRTARAGRGGKSITLITPNDIEEFKSIEALINVRMNEYKINDQEVAKICTQVSVSKGEAYIKLDFSGFYEKKMINLRKKWILDGLDPDVEEKKYMTKLKKKNSKDAKKKAEGKIKKLTKGKLTSLS